MVGAMIARRTNFPPISDSPLSPLAMSCRLGEELIAASLLVIAAYRAHEFARLRQAIASLASLVGEP